MSVTLSRHNWRPGQPRRTKVAIVGFEEQLLRTAPLNDPSYEVWAFNHANRVGFMRDEHGDLRADCWFDLHEQHAQSREDLEWIHTCPVPIYLTSLYTDNPNARAYPIEAIMDRYESRYFCSSFAYALVLAHYMGYEEIALHGCNLAWGRERAVERGNLEYWIGRLHGDRCHIDTSGSPELCAHPHRYGFDYTEEKEWTERRMASLALELLADERIRAHTYNHLSVHLDRIIALNQLAAHVERAVKVSDAALAEISELAEAPEGQ